MTTLCIACESLPPERNRWDRIRSAVFWTCVGLALISPAALSALILLQA